MLLLGMKSASIVGLASMIVLPSEPQFYTAIGTLFMVGNGSVALQIIKNRQGDKISRI